MTSRPAAVVIKSAKVSMLFCFILSFFLVSSLLFFSNSIRFFVCEVCYLVFVCQTHTRLSLKTIVGGCGVGVVTRATPIPWEDERERPATQASTDTSIWIWGLTRDFHQRSNVMSYCGIQLIIWNKHYVHIQSKEGVNTGNKNLLSR